jgi:hypothetical protein
MNEPLFRFIKICDIGYITVIYCIFAVILARVFNEIFGKFNEEEEKKKGKLRQFIEISFIFWIYGIVMYTVKNIVEIFPSPFDGINGFKHNLVKELKSGSVFTFMFIWLQRNFRYKLLYLFNNTFFKTAYI